MNKQTKVKIGVVHVGVGRVSGGLEIANVLVLENNINSLYVNLISLHFKIC